MTIRWHCLPFESLPALILYDLLRLRSEVFVVEQNCVFQDIDRQDMDAHHLLGYNEAGELAAYARLFDAGKCYEEASIGRVIVAQPFRQLRPGPRADAAGPGPFRRAVWPAAQQNRRAAAPGAVLQRVRLRAVRADVRGGRYSAHSHAAGLACKQDVKKNVMLSAETRPAIVILTVAKNLSGLSNIVHQ